MNIKASYRNTTISSFYGIDNQRIPKFPCYMPQHSPFDVCIFLITPWNPVKPFCLLLGSDETCHCVCGKVGNTRIFPCHQLQREVQLFMSFRRYMVAAPVFVQVHPIHQLFCSNCRQIIPSITELPAKSFEEWSKSWHRQ